MRGSIHSKNGMVVLCDVDRKQDVIPLTATAAMWLSFFLQQHTTSELIVQLRLAAQHAQDQQNSRLLSKPEEKEFKPNV